MLSYASAVERSSRYADNDTLPARFHDLFTITTNHMKQEMLIQATHHNHMHQSIITCNFDTPYLPLTPRSPQAIYGTASHNFLTNTPAQSSPENHNEIATRNYHKKSNTPTSNNQIVTEYESRVIH